MSALPQPENWTVEAYFAAEAESEIRHEFIDGQVYAMAGASERHNQIASAFHYRLYGHLLERPCQVFQSDMRVQVRHNVFFYPDLVVVCGTALYREGSRNTLLNPGVIIEILSASTEDYDRGRKFKYYRELSDLHDYLLVAQNQCQVEHYTRQTAESWLLTVLSQPEDTIRLPSLDFSLPMGDIYQKVTFEDGE
ncbi:MAG TPA: Uma2 family endonuclease [Phototrophicaceae bacterium]|nr:Uma2 family endonuclease [Phototrophicaceae bacterium]